MKAYRDLTSVQRKERTGRRFSLTGLGILFLGMMASFVPNFYPPGTEPPHAVAAFLQDYWALASFIALPAGFLCASLGSYFINRYARRRWPGSRIIGRPDEVFERNLKGFDDKFAFFAHSLPQSNYVVTGPCGVLLFSVRNDRTRVTIQGDRWRERFSFGRIFTLFAREGVGYPPQELADQTKKMRELLDKAPPPPAGSGPERQLSLAEVPIEGAALFLNDLAQVEMDGATIPVLRADQLKEYIRRRAKEVKLNPATTRALTDYLREQSKHQEEG
jgi:hypothetical protein